MDARTEEGKWVNVRDRQPSTAGLYKCKVDAFPNPDIEIEGNLFDGSDWCHFQSCRQFINQWWEPNKQ